MQKLIVSFSEYVSGLSDLEFVLLFFGFVTIMTILDIIFFDGNL